MSRRGSGLHGHSAALPGCSATRQLGLVGKTQLQGQASWRCGLFRSTSKAGSLGMLALFFCQPSVPLKVCIPEGKAVMVLGSLG